MGKFIKVTVAALFCTTTGIALADPSIQMQINGDAVNAAIHERNRNLAAYTWQVDQIVATQIRAIRVAEEQAAMETAGHPVPLPTGACRAIVTVAPDGTVQRAQLAGCASEELGKVELQAIKQSSPLPPLGVIANITVQNSAPVATPGVDGN